MRGYKMLIIYNTYSLFNDAHHAPPKISDKNNITMNTKHYSEEEELKRQYAMKMMSEFEGRFIHSYIYGALSVFMYLISKELEEGTLLGITNILGIGSLYMWYAANSWVQKVKIEIHIQINKPKNINDRYELYSRRAIINGSASFACMFIVFMYFIWQPL